MFSPKEKFNVVVFGKCRDRTFDEFTRKKKKKKDGREAPLFSLFQCSEFVTGRRNND